MRQVTGTTAIVGNWAVLKLGRHNLILQLVVAAKTQIRFRFA